MKMNFNKMLAMLVCLCLLFTICFNGVLAADKSKLKGKYSVVRNDKNICTVKTEEDGNELYASLDKLTNEITVKVVEKTKKKLFGKALGKDKETNYSVVIEDFCNDELTAVLIDKETKKEHKVRSKENLEKVKAQIPVVLGAGALAALVKALLYTAAIGLTFAAAMSIADAIRKNKNNNERIYFRANCTYPGAEVNMSYYYTEDQAATLLELGYDFYAVNSSDAIYLCKKVSGGYTGPTNDGNSKNAYHYHPLSYVGRAHVFYGNDRNLKFIQ
jgi:hypothetical protein